MKKTQAVAPVITADVDTSALPICLKSILGLRPDTEIPAERCASTGRSLPTKIHGVDVGAWVAWSVTGLLLFSGDRQPTMRMVIQESRRLLLALYLGRHDNNITRIAEATGTSRRAVREHLKATGLYRTDPRQVSNDPPVPPVPSEPEGDNLLLDP